MSTHTPITLAPMPWHERVSVAKANADLAPTILEMLVTEAENARESEWAAAFQCALDCLPEADAYAEIDALIAEDARIERECEPEIDRYWRDSIHAERAGMSVRCQKGCGHEHPHNPRGLRQGRASDAGGCQPTLGQLIEAADLARLRNDYTAGKAESDRREQAQFDTGDALREYLTETLGLTKKQIEAMGAIL